ncbi:MAG TPA: saccharopine dehydrogenase C-terminal domain-containing protein [Actinomycetota bacterium]|nr:saccharopine dehydrogenase C-terminal domain-containing protein [Actinomycetota bacterium]
MGGYRIVHAVVVGGAGAMGRVIVRDLAGSAGVSRVTVADLDVDGARQVAALVDGRAAVQAVRADVGAASFVDLLRDADVCVASVAYRLNPLIAEACLQSRCGYVDLGGLFHVARQVLGYSDRFREAGVTGATCMGGSPGITNLLAVLGARELDAVRAVHVRLGSFDPSAEGLPLPIPYSLDTILDEFSLPAMAYRDGAFTEVEPLGEPEDVDFPAPIGRRTAVTTLHSEVATFPESKALQGVRHVTFKIAFEPGLIERFKLLAAIGLSSTEPIDVGGHAVRPRDVLSVLGRRLPQAAGTDDVECLRVVLEGERNGHPSSVIAESLIQPDSEAGLGAGARDTGIPPSIVAQMIAKGDITERGMFAPEDIVDPDLFFARLLERGIDYRISRSRP